MAFKWLKKKGGHPTGDPEGTAVEPPVEIPLETTAPGASPSPGTEKTGGFFSRLKKGLSKTRQFLTTDIEDLFASGRKIDDNLLEELEELLITADVGIRTAMDLIGHISSHASRIADAEALKTRPAPGNPRMLHTDAPAPDPGSDKPHVIMVSASTVWARPPPSASWPPDTPMTAGKSSSRRRTPSARRPWSS